MSRTRLALIPLSVMVGSLVACSAPPQPATSATSTATAPSGPNDVAADLPSPVAYPTEDGASRAAAEAVAGAAMTSFVRIDLPADAWLDQLSPRLTGDAVSAFYGTDPLEVPARQVTGPPRWDGSTSAYLATVVVPTDVGNYRVLLIREGQGAPWLVQNISPPDGLP